MKGEDSRKKIFKGQSDILPFRLTILILKITHKYILFNYRFTIILLLPFINSFIKRGFNYILLKPMNSDVNNHPRTLSLENVSYQSILQQLKKKLMNNWFRVRWKLLVSYKFFPFVYLLHTNLRCNVEQHFSFNQVYAVSEMPKLHYFTLLKICS